MVLCAHPFASLPTATVLVWHLFQAGILTKSLQQRLPCLARLLDLQASFSSTQFSCGDPYCVWRLCRRLFK